MSQEEKVEKLEGLNVDNQDSWDLFHKHYRDITKEEKIDFSKTLPDIEKFKKPYRDEHGKIKSKLKYKINKLGDHHFFDLLGRNPQAIILNALLRKSNSKLCLSSIYQMTVEQRLNQGNVVQDNRDEM